MPAQVAVEAAEAAGKAVSNDIAVFRTKFDVETGKGRKKRLVPVEAELHVNPVSILSAAALALAGALAGTVAWHGVSVPNPLGPPVVIFPGLKDTAFGKDLARGYERRAIKRRIEASGGEVVEAQTGLTPGEIQNILLATIGNTECQLLNREWQTALRQGRTEDAESLFRRAQENGCPWTGRR